MRRNWKKYSLVEAVYGDYPEENLKPLNTFGLCTCSDENCTCGDICQCGDTSCTQCGSKLAEGEDQEEILTDDVESSELEENAVGAGGVAGYTGPMDEDDEKHEG